MTDNKFTEEKNTEKNIETAERKTPSPVPVYAERAETVLPDTDTEDLKALALAYANYLAEHNIKPGEPTFTDSIPEEPEEIESAEEPAGQEPAAEAEAQADGEPAAEAEAQADEAPDKGKQTDKKKRKSSSGRRKLFNAEEPSAEAIDKIAGKLEKADKPGVKAGSVIDVHDRLQAGLDDAARGVGRDFVTIGHKINSTYKQSRKVIGIALLVMGLFATLILIIFDRFTVYEYAYNGKTLGYVNNQEDVTDVLDIAGAMLTENSSGSGEIKFTANQNVTFKMVDARGKSTDDADIAVNKLVYMTDIETEAFGVFDGSELKAVVKSSEDAELLLEQTKATLSAPDDGMRLVSSDFINPLEIKPINVLLTSVQSNSDAMTLMTEGGKMEVYHIVEEGETLGSLADTFGVDVLNIFNEDNSAPVEEAVQGDKVCVHREVEPVSVEMVETGRTKEIIEFETIKKKSDDYYKGDTHTEQEGKNGVQIFEGTMTKVNGEVTERDGVTEERRKVQNKIIIIGTAERPKTAPTGTYAMPIEHYTLSSRFGYRWGRLHSGLDLAAPTGTPIYASDGGTVVRAGWYAGYGLCVDIDHENGRMTRYGHCSQLLVNAGDKVYQGQNVALVGNTGHSFGSHLHFEINLNGSPVDPAPYLGL